MENKKVVVIGGGPAGMMAAVAAGEYSNDVALTEKNTELGKKLKITGGGRCNLTNIAEPAFFIEKVVTNSKFARKSLEAFPSKELISLIEKNGCPLKVEEEGRVFPVSDNPSDVIQVFKKLLWQKKVDIYLQCEATDILVEGNKVSGVRTNQGVILCDAAILATGGVSYPHTGSTGMGHTIAKSIGHTTAPLKPSLTSMEIREKWLTEMTGISFSNTIIKTKLGKKSIAIKGDLLLTHYGVSGPAVFELSTYLNKEVLPQDGHEIYIDFLPEISEEELREWFISSEVRNKKIAAIFMAHFPKKFVKSLLSKLKIDEETNISQLKKEHRNMIISTLKNFKLTIMRLRSIKSAIVTSGGISAKEVNSSTMESRLIKGLFFAGEILDIDALTGGYNLQLAFSTGYVAGSSAGAR